MKSLKERKAERKEREEANREEARENGNLPPEQEPGQAGSGAGTAILNNDGSKGASGPEGDKPGESSSNKPGKGNGGGAGWSANG